MVRKYNHRAIEKKWQKEWDKSGIYKTKAVSKKPKYYVLDMFPYPSGEGLHVGNPRGYIGTDIYSRWKRMNGYNILHPMGFDSFGLPAEQYAIKHKIHPRVAVEKNVARYKKQLSILGFDYDWDREVVTSDPLYYKWTQWIFLKLFEKGLAYESHEPINWCPTCQTGLALEDLEDGKCERCGSIVEKKPMRQWVLKIRKYADRLLSDLDELNWPESIKESQRNWIGRSKGAEIEFKLVASSKKLEAIKVFTTRPDTLFGATYMVLSPEHPLLNDLKGQISNWKEVKKYIEKAKKKTEIERVAVEKEKTGVGLEGIKAINPANKEKIPVWVADYVLVHYGTGAIMAVPAHDQRDYDFAKKYSLPINTVIEPVTGERHEKEEFRRSIVALVRDPKNGKILSINWGSHGGNLFIGGGLKDREDPVECAKREIQEETGYKNVKLIEQSEKIHHHYFAHSKDIKRGIDAIGLYFELVDHKKVDQKLEDDEHGKFSVEWISDKQAEEVIVDPLHKYLLEKFIFGKVYTGNGVMINSGKFDEMDSEEAKDKITKFVSGKKMVNYKLRDWVFSRQRYWGEPIPIIHCEKCGIVPVAEKDLPVELPEVKHYEPTGTGESPLANIESWVNVKCPKCRGPAKRETNTMPQWAGSCWYYLRYIDPKNKKALIDKKKEKYWSPVDLYVGGTEHATRHLIYARFWHKFLYDIGVVNYKEPFTQLRNQGMILAADGRKMSKRWGNVINPDDIIESYGADTLRLYEMFMGPFDQSVNWSTESIIGPRRFLERVWRLQEKVLQSRKHAKEKGVAKTPACADPLRHSFSEVRAPAGRREDIESLLQRTIKKVTEDIENFHFNTAISTLMILLNEMEHQGQLSETDQSSAELEIEYFKIFLKLLAPFAPYITEELYQLLRENTQKLTQNNAKAFGSIHESEWPQYDENKLREEQVNIIVQINSKVRTQITVLFDIDEGKIKEIVLDDYVVKKWLRGKEVVKIIYVKNKLVNIVVKN